MQCCDFVHQAPQKPRAVVEALDKHVIGQAAAKKVLATASYNHYKRAHHIEEQVKKAALAGVQSSDDEGPPPAELRRKRPKAKQPPYTAGVLRMLVCHSCMLGVHGNLRAC